MRGRAKRVAGLLLLFAGLGAWQSDTLLLDAPEGLVRLQERRLGRRLRRRHGLAALVSFDSDRVREWVGGAPVFNLETERVPDGRFGDARTFRGHRDSFVSTDVHWDGLGEAFSVSAWVRLEPGGFRQAIVYARAGGRATGLLLLDGQVTLAVPSGGGGIELSYPFERYGEFVHLAAVVDGAAGRAVLYEDGVAKATAGIVSPVRPAGRIEFGKHNPTRAEAPLRGAMDETAVWSRALAESEVQALARAHRPLLETAAPVSLALYRLASASRDALRSAVRAADLLSPFYHVGRIYDARLPELHLTLSRADERHFNRMHNRCQANGHFTRNADDRRGIDVAFAGNSFRAGLRLYGDGPGHWEGPRKSFVLETERNPIAGMERMLLVPFENANILRPLFEQRLTRRINATPLPRAGLLVLAINGGLEGVYYYEDHTRPGFRGSLSRAGERDAFSVTPMLTREQALAEFDALLGEIAGPLLNDLRSGLSRREMRRWFRWQRREVAGIATATDPVEAFANGLDAVLIAGDNFSPGHVTADLHLDLRPPDGLSLAWTSEDPDWVGDDGAIRRPADGAPRAARLRAAVSGHGRTADAAVDLRVMPADIAVPPVALWLSRPVEIFGRSPVRIEQRPDGAPAERLMDGGVRFRGNTTLLNEKRSYSIRTRGAHDIFGDDGARHVYFMAVPPDRSFMRNRLSYDLFRALGTETAPRFTPRVEPVELFVNGDYRGVYEMGQRIDRFLVGFDAYEDGESHPALLYNAQGQNANFRVLSRLSYRQREPPPLQTETWAPFEDLIWFVGYVPTDVFCREAPARIDLENVMDFAFLLNLSNNGDGANRNFYLARDRGPGQRFFFVPWDYDKTFGNQTDRWLSNHLVDRLLDECPAFRAGFKARWAEHRAGPWNEAAILGRIDAMEAMLGPYTPWNYERWNTEDRDHALLAEHMRAWVRERLRFMDAWIEAL